MVPLFTFTHAGVLSPPPTASAQSLSVRQLLAQTDVHDSQSAMHENEQSHCAEVVHGEL